MKRGICEVFGCILYSAVEQQVCISLIKTRHYGKKNRLLILSFLAND